MGNRDTRHDSPRSCRDALCKKCESIHKTRQNKKRSHKKTPDSRNTPSTTNLEEEETVDAPGNDGNASMPEQVKRPNPLRKKKTMMMMMMMISY
jgi:hypothetical protein